MEKHFDNATRKKKTVVFQQDTKPPTHLQTMLKRPVHYFTTGRQLDQKKLRDVFSEKTPFWIPSDNEEFSFKVLNKLWKQRFREEERSYKYYDRPNYRSRQKVDILERLHIPEEEPPHVDAITDIDPNFFKIVQGRPIKERLDLCQYINDVRETLRVRLKTGYQQDEMLLLDEQFIEEQRRIDGINEQHKIYVDSFEEFLSKDHGESMSILKKSEECSKSLSEKDQEYKHLLRHLGLIRSRVYILEENWRNCKMYQKFLYRVSPLTWRVEHDYIHMEGSKLANEGSDVSLFGRYRLDSSESVASLNSLINMFEQDIDKHEEPHLYFTDPEELNKVFEDMEHQNLNSLLHLESLFGPLEDLRKEREQTEKTFENEVKSIHEKIAGLKRAITWEENRAEEMEKYSRDLMAGMFRDLVVSDHVLTLHVYVEDTYEAVISKNEGNLKLHEMMKAIEVRYDQLMLELENLPRDLVKEVKMEVFKEQDRLIKVAEDAADKAHLMDRLISRLKKSLEPPPVRIGKPIMHRSAIPVPKRKPRKKPKDLTQKQKDFLNFFTEYCQYTDSVNLYIPKI